MHQVLGSGVVKLAGAALFGAILLQRDSDAAGAAACFGCAGFMFFIIVGIIAINIALLVWVARDAKSRGMDNSILWMVLVMITGLVGLIIYILVRPQGNLVPCAHCKMKRMPVSAKCPHCGNA
jgi:cytochrome bd-type quinol oxidase subunit 2